MSNKAETRRFTAHKIVSHNATVSDWSAELETVIRWGQQKFSYHPQLTAALVDRAKENVLGIEDASSDDTDTLHDKLPAGIGKKKAVSWAVRVDAGESCESIAANTYSTTAETVAEAADLGAIYTGLENGSEDTNSGTL